MVYGECLPRSASLDPAHAAPAALVGQKRFVFLGRDSVSVPANLGADLVTISYVLGPLHIGRNGRTMVAGVLGCAGSAPNRVTIFTVRRPIEVAFKRLQLSAAGATLESFGEDFPLRNALPGMVRASAFTRTRLALGVRLSLVRVELGKRLGLATCVAQLH
jgi:hypothetical protein